MSGREGPTRVPPSASAAHPHYPALWHLEFIGVLSAASRSGAGWTEAARRLEGRDAGARETRVALIDNSVAWQHPNLVTAIDASRMIDFVSARLGAFPVESDPERLEPSGHAHAVPDAPARAVTREIALAAGAHAEGLLEELLARLHEDSGESPPPLAATRAAFSAHGTAMAGLIGARPAVVAKPEPPLIGAASDALRHALAPTSGVLPYAGVDPFCRVVPVSASFDPDPEQYLLALLYAALIEADVIVLARDFPDPLRATVTGRDPLERGLVEATARNPIGAEESALWDELASLLESLSRRIPILCAAGNGDGERTLYPAALASDTNGIVAVGACNAFGHVAGYSPSGASVDVFAPSGDGERTDAGLVRLDALGRALEGEEDDPALGARVEHQLATQTRSGATRETYALQDLITTDVPGRFGYDRGHLGISADDAESAAAADPASCFCRFGGTSGAVAVAAGFLSLMLSSGAHARSDEATGADAGVRAKRALIDATRNARAAGAETSDAAADALAADGAPSVPVLHWSAIADR